MKTLKALSLSLLAAVAVSGSASATPTVVHITGSTAFRNAAIAGIIDYLSVNGTVPVIAGYTSGSSLLGAGGQILANGSINTAGTGTATTIVETYWSGSVAGVVDLSLANSTGTYYDPSTLSTADLAAVNASTVTVNSNDGTNSTVYGGGAPITSGTTAAVADAAFADTDKTSASTCLTGANLSAPINGFSTIAAIQAAMKASTIVDSGSTSSGGAGKAKTVGVVAFEWVMANANSTGLAAMGLGSVPTNMTQQAALSLIANGYIAQSLLTGTNNPADSANYFYSTGRNEDSGTRIVTFGESGFPLSGNPAQYSLTGSTIALFPANTPVNTQPNISWSQVGHSGYASGGNVATILKTAQTGTLTFTNGQATSNTGAAFVFGAVGVTDAVTAVNGGATAMTYNGVPFSIANIQNGKYTFWGFEHLYRISGTSAAKTVVNGIAQAVFLTDADIASNGKHSAVSLDPASGILFDSNFNVTRNTQGSAITHL